MPAKIDDLLVTSIAHFASDLHVKAGSFPVMRIGGELHPIADAPRLSPEDTLDMAFSMMSNRQKQKLKEVSEVDIAYSVKGLGRFRANIFQQRGTVSIVLRVIPDQSKNTAALGLPSVIDQIAEERRGLILVTGATGSGKSTTLAAMIDRINTTRSGHIVTIEDPIEFLHSHKNSTIHQRELHSDTPSFALALRAALRQAPKVILVGEMRDRETMEVAMEAAETGHLVLSTLHTIDAAKSVERIIGVFPKNEEQSIRLRLSQSFRFIVSQRLLPRANGSGRVAAIEILKATSRTKEYIERGESEGKSLMDAMEQGDMEGMQTFDGEIEKLVRKGVVSKDDGLAYSSNSGNLLLRLGELGGGSAVKNEPKAPAQSDSILDMIER